MMEKRNERKYFRVELKNVLSDDEYIVSTWAIEINGILYTVLGNKKIFLYDETFSKEKFIESNCPLIGIKQEEVSEGKIGNDLRFTFASRINTEKILNEISNMVESIQSSISMTLKK